MAFLRWLLLFWRWMCDLHWPNQMKGIFSWLGGEAVPFLCLRTGKHAALLTAGSRFMVMRGINLRVKVMLWLAEEKKQGDVQPQNRLLWEAALCLSLLFCEIDFLIFWNTLDWGFFYLLPKVSWLILSTTTETQETVSESGNINNKSYWGDKSGKN